MFGDDPLWYKDAILYELHVRAFHDSNGDGVGDFRGLSAKLDYIQSLGVNSLWLLPHYPSPLKDDGYDIADYHGIHPDYGTRADFRQFIREAHRRGLKVIIELVINHTSDQHPWFQAARAAPAGSNKRNYYLWSNNDKKFPETRIIFRDVETSNWAWDSIARAYYWHRFFSHQPDLNFNNPSVVRAVSRIMRYWFDLGVDGMRLDAIPYLCVREGTNNESLPETHAVLKYMREQLDKHYKNRMFLAEANQWPEDMREYFGNGDECHMAFHFPLMPRMYMALAQEDRHPIVEILKQTPEIPDSCQWAIFLRNHDELTLEMVTDRERDYMYQAYAMEPRARLNFGIRRRLAPLMENDRDKIELVNSLLMSMPGSPVIYYGDEIGMGDNVYLGDRNGVRTPMQWSSDRNGGFSRADPARLYLPPVMDPVYGFEAVNVEAQSRSPSSLLNWMRRIITVRNAHRAFGRGSLTFIEPGNRKVLAYLREYEGEVILCAANLARSSQPVELDLARYKGRVPVELIGRTAFPPISDFPYQLTLAGYGFFWFRLATDVDPPRWHTEIAPISELPVLVLVEGWRTLFSAQSGPAADVKALMAHRASVQLQREVLPPFLAVQRWFVPKREDIEAIKLVEESEWLTEQGSWVLAVARVELRGAEPQLYSLPLAIYWDKDIEERAGALRQWIIAKVRQRERFGFLLDAFGDEAFCRSLVAAIARNLELPLSAGRLCFRAIGTSAAELDISALEVRRPAFEQTEPWIAFSDKLLLKAYRQVQLGVQPECEIGLYLTEVARFAHIAPLVGTVDYRRQEGGTLTLALLQGYVENQGNGWSYTVDYLKRFLEIAPSEPAAIEPGAELSVHTGFLALAETLGRRTGEMHQALSRTTGDPAFDPEPIEPAELTAWVEQVQIDVAHAIAEVGRLGATATEAGAKQGEGLAARRDSLIERMRATASLQPRMVKTRYHGDYDLERVLLANNDFVIVGFVGDPMVPWQERRRKHSPLRDVASMIASFHYAAGVALANGAAERPERRARLEALIDDWLNHAKKAFLSGYAQAMAGSPAYPEDPRALDALIDLFLLERGCYELRSTLEPHPPGTARPLSAIMRLLQDGSGP